ncbi:MAG: ThuA domain-containing protein [Planctomycetia bacterium]|nr:ThuA domain-containing protein [Planctomycetia bacterium]
MKRRDFVRIGTTAALATTITSAISHSRISANEAPEKDGPVRVLFIHGGHGYDQEAMSRMLGALPGMKVTEMEFSVAVPLLKPGLKKDFDAILFYDYTNSDHVTKEQQRDFVELLGEGGIGVVFWHHAICTHFLDDYAIIGGRYHINAERFHGTDVPASTWKEGVDIPVQIANQEHPITRGIEPFTIHDEAYGGVTVNPSVDVLLTADHPECSEPFLWTHTSGKSRVVYLMPGHGKACWDHPVFPELLSRCLLWSLRGKIED